MEISIANNSTRQLDSTSNVPSSKHLRFKLRRRKSLIILLIIFNPSNKSRLEKKQEIKLSLLLEPKKSPI